MSSLSGNVQPSNRTFVCLVNFHARGPVGGGAVDPESSRTQEPSVFWCLGRQHSREFNQVPCHGPRATALRQLDWLANPVRPPNVVPVRPRGSKDRAVQQR